ncbi:MAG: PEP-utilizing enzyme [Actinomycetota bacterium]|nr:PEP-utilizing enzyme [Actinomycetota bacterium]
MGSEQLQFSAPGPGSWELDSVHFPRPATAYWAKMHPAPFSRGFGELAANYGLPFLTREVTYLNGFMYGTIRPLQPDEIPQRFARAEEVFEKRFWREQLREWDETCKPRSIEKHRALQAVEPDRLPVEELATYLRQCADHHAEMIFQHMRFTAAATVPTGDLLVHVMEWTGLPPAKLLGMMRGFAPVSRGQSAQLDRLISSVRQDPAARSLLESEGEPGKVLDELRDLPSDAGQAMASYLDFAGYRLLDGFDISGRFALEMPDALLRAIRSSVAGTAVEGSDVEDLVSDVRSQVPDQHRGQFNELLDEARLTYRIRDERGVFSDIWASGLMRRAALSAGRRLVEKEGVHDPEHFVHADIDEMVSLLLGQGGPSADELEARSEHHGTRTAKEAPGHLGDPPSPPPDPSGLPPGAARMMRAFGFSIGNMFANSEEEHEGSVIKGLPASGGVFEGVVRRVSSRADFDRIQQGDVLVTESTTEAFNILLPLLGAIVTDSGGLLSHAAIVAREYGIPGVVGTRDATQRIPEGSAVRVDGDAGEVTVRS